MTTNEFRAFLEREGGTSLHDFFQSYVYGADAGFPGDVAQEADFGDSLHPPPLSEKEIRWLR